METTDMASQEGSRNEQTRRQSARKTLQDARMALYPRLSPFQAFSIESRVGIPRSSSPQNLPNASLTTASESEASRSSAEMPRRLFLPSPQELSRKPLGHAKNSWVLESPSGETPAHRPHQACYNQAKQVLPSMMRPLVNFWMDNGLPTPVSEADWLLHLADPPPRPNAVERCADAVVRHFNFQGKFSEVQYLDRQKYNLEDSVYIAHLNTLAHKMYSEMNRVFVGLRNNDVRHNTRNREKYDKHKKWNMRRARDGNGQYPGLAHSLPPPLHEEVQPQDIEADQPGGLDLYAFHPNQPENWGAMDLDLDFDGVPW
ncbi:hypothetical protein Daesc_006124 [Daldinia eschscholtzii]|uniref:Uncharacterized protein n=1 Tax=Daldinia eschscholtzii TaxID=292717 RepID=A0AAX6MHG0_9PEZI